MMGNRFIVESHEILADNFKVYVLRDTQTNVQYLMNSGGITPLLTGLGGVSVGSKSMEALLLNRTYVAVIKSISEYFIYAEILDPARALHFSRDADSLFLFTTGKVGDRFQVRYLGADPKTGEDKFAIEQNSFSIEI